MQTTKIDGKEYRPYRGYVIVQLVDRDKVTPGGIIIPDTAKENKARVEKTNHGLVLAVGEDRRRFIEKDGKITGIVTESADCKVGDQVLFDRWSGLVSDDRAGDTKWIVKFEDIVAVVAGGQDE